MGQKQLSEFEARTARTKVRTPWTDANIQAARAMVDSFRLEQTMKKQPGTRGPQKTTTPLVSGEEVEVFLPYGAWTKATVDRAGVIGFTIVGGFSSRDYRGEGKTWRKVK